MDYLDECSRMAYDAFSALDHDIVFYNAIRSAEDAFTECLMYICIFYFIDQQFTAFKPLAHRPKPMLAKP